MVKISKIIMAAGMLGVVGMTALPIASGYAVQDSSIINATVKVAESISVEADQNYVADFGAASNATDSSLTNAASIGLVVPGQRGGATEATPGTVRVTSNIPSGYALTVATNGANTNLVGDGGGNIPALATHAAGTPGWAIRFSTTAGSTALGARQAVPAAGSGLSIANTSTPSVTGGDTYAYGFSSSIADVTLPGSYVATVVFTAVSN